MSEGEASARWISPRHVLGIALYFAIPTALLAGFHPIAWDLKGQLGDYVGVLRFGLLLVTGAVLLALPFAVRRFGLATHGVRSSEVLARIGLVIVVAALALHLVAAVQSIAQTHKTGRIALDQGENIYQGLEMLFDGGNPYGRGALLDPIEYVHQVMMLRDSECLAFRDPPDQAHLDAIWYGERLLSEQDRAFVVPDARCEDARKAFEMLGIKYGPTTLATFAPGVVLFGRPGIFVVQIALLLGICVVLAIWSREIAQGDLFLASLVFWPLLGTVHIYVMTMMESASDLPGVLYALLGLFFFQRGRLNWAAALIGLSVSAKLMPGLMYTPMLLAMGVRPWLWFAATALLPFAPFAVWEPGGLAGNIVLYNLVRDADRSSLAYYLAAYDRNVLLGLTATAVLWLFWRVHRAGWQFRHHLQTLLVAHIGVVGTAKNFHNNYVIWFLPLVGLYALAVLFDARGKPASPARVDGANH